MNYGCVPEAGVEPLALATTDEPDRTCIQLYEQTVSPASLRGRDIVEVGSGRGGGASYLTRTHQPRHYTGIDFSANAVALCRQRHATVPNLSFLVGDAENLPLADASCDIVVNVESSHCYGDLARFFREAARVLRPGGHFAYTDFRTVADLEQLDATLAAVPGWKRIARVDITARVVAALDADETRKRQLIGEIVPARMRPLFGEFAGLSDGKIYQGFQRRELLYCRWVFRKTPAPRE